MTIISASSTEIKATLNSNCLQPKSTLRIKAGVQTLVSTDSFRLLPPIIKEITPLQGSVNTQIVIEGDNFSPVAQNIWVDIGGVRLSAGLTSPTTLVAKIPAGIAPGNYTVSITVAKQTSVFSGSFTVTP